MASGFRSLARLYPQFRGNLLERSQDNLAAWTTLQRVNRRSPTLILHGSWGMTVSRDCANPPKSGSNVTLCDNVLALSHIVTFGLPVNHSYANQSFGPGAGASAPVRRAAPLPSKPTFEPLSGPFYVETPGVIAHTSPTHQSGSEVQLTPAVWESSGGLGLVSLQVGGAFGVPAVHVYLDGAAVDQLIERLCIAKHRLQKPDPRQLAFDLHCHGR